MGIFISRYWVLRRPAMCRRSRPAPEQRYRPEPAFRATGYAHRSFAKMGIPCHQVLTSHPTGQQPSITRGAETHFPRHRTSLADRLCAKHRQQDTSQSPGTGHLALTGYPPVSLQASGTSLFPGTGHLVLTGYQPSITRQDGHFRRQGPDTSRCAAIARASRMVA